MGRSTEKETGLSEQRKYRSWTAQQKLEIVLAGLRGDRTVKEVCREHAISETLYYGWRDKLLEGGREALAGKDERQGEQELRRKVARARAGARAQDLRARDRGGSVAGLGVRRARRPVSRAGRAKASPLRPWRVCCRSAARRSTGRRRRGRPPQRRPPTDPVEAAIVEEAPANQTDGYRMVAAFVRRKLGRPVNRKRVLRVMRERKLIQRRRPLERRKRPGFFRVERPRQLWQLDMTSVWVAEHGWCYLNAIIDCCTREIVAWQLELRCRADEAIARRRTRRRRRTGSSRASSTLGTDNGSAFTARRFRARLGELGIRHRRGGPKRSTRRERWWHRTRDEPTRVRTEPETVELMRLPRERDLTSYGWRNSPGSSPIKAWRTSATRPSATA